MGKAGEDCFDEIAQLLESLGAVRLTLTEGPGLCCAATWILQGSKHRLTVTRRATGVVTVQSGNRTRVRGTTFLKKTLASIEAQIAAQRRIESLPKD